MAFELKILLGKGFNAIKYISDPVLGFLNKDIYGSISWMELIIGILAMLLIGKLLEGKK